MSKKVVMREVRKTVRGNQVHCDEGGWIECKRLTLLTKATAS